MADLSFLSNPASAQFQSPDILGIAGKAMSLGSMAQQQQLQALNLAKQQDLISLYGSPAGTQFLQSLLTPGGGAQGGGGGQLDPTFLSGHAAAPEFIQTALGLAEKQAQIGKNVADTAKARQESADMELQNVGRITAGLETDPTKPGYDPQLNQQVATAAVQRLQATGIPGILQSFDLSSPDKAVSSITAGLMDPKVRQGLLIAPQELADKQGELAMNQAKFYGGEAFEDPDTKAWFVKIPKQGGGFIIQAASTGGVPAQPAP